MPVTFTTSLPDADQPVLGNGVEDEIQVDRESQATNYGTVRIETRETGQSTWGASAVGFDERTITHDTVTTTIPGREDGEAYEVRLRTETEHRTGAWTDPVAITTKFPGATDPSASASGRTTVDVTWTDASDNEDGFILERRTVRDDGTRSAWRTLVNLAPNTAAYTDDTARPATTLEYRVEAFTDDAAATSSTATATTPASRLETSPRAAAGWTVEIDHPAGQTLRPDLLEEPEFNPVLNGVPTATVGVRGGPEWDDDSLERATCRVWHRGRRLPLSSLQSVRVRPERVELTLRGSRELDTTVQRSVTEREAHALLRDLVESETTLAANVDDPQAETVSDTPVQSLSSGDDLRDAVADGVTPSGPLVVDGDRLRQAQAAWLVDAANRLGLAGSVEAPGGSGGVAEALSAGTGQAGSFEITIDHEIPASEVAVKLRRKAVRDTDDDGIYPVPGYRVEIDGETLYSERPSSINKLSWLWDSGYGLSTSLSPGTHTVRVVEDGDDNGGLLWIDAVAIYDSRYSGDLSFPDSVDDSGYLSGPERFPTTTSVEFAAVDLARQVVGGRAEIDVSATAGQQSVGVSNDGGQTYTTAANSTVVDTDFSSPSTSLQCRVTLSRHGSRTTAAPTQGFQTTALEGLSLAADLDETPLVDGRVLEGDLIDVVADVADSANLVTELTYERDTGPTLQVTTPGQRESRADPSLTDWSTTTEHDSVVRRATVTGRSQLGEETITASADTAVPLDHDHLRPGKERVVDVDTETAYTLGADYEIDWQAGELTALSAGDIPDGTSLRVSYEREVRATVTAPDWDGDPTTETTVSLPSVATETAAEQAARTLVRTGSEPRRTVSATVETGERTWSLVDALSLDGVPQSESLVVQSVSGRQLRLGTRDPIEEIVGRLQSRLESTSRSV